MGKKLSNKQSMQSLLAVQDYLKDFARVECVSAIVKRDKEIIYRDSIEVSVNDYNIYYKVNFYWEEKISNYHEMGLSGCYSTGYYEMKYSGETLEIHDGNITICVTK